MTFNVKLNINIENLRNSEIPNDGFRLSRFARTVTIESFSELSIKIRTP